MRVWDIHPGYLNRQSLLGEHRELHGIVSILVNKKVGYSRHPETLRWVGHDGALAVRHQQLSCEMALRGFNDRTPVPAPAGKVKWPEIYIDPPEQQFLLIKGKYADKEKGRIPLPETARQLWNHHQISVLARNPAFYKEIEAAVSRNKITFTDLAVVLTELLREQPSENGIRNALQQLRSFIPNPSPTPSGLHSPSLRTLLMETQQIAMTNPIQPLISSTALSELMVWLPSE